MIRCEVASIGLSESYIDVGGRHLELVPVQGASSSSCDSRNRVTVTLYTEQFLGAKVLRPVLLHN